MYRSQIKRYKNTLRCTSFNKPKKKSSSKKYSTKWEAGMLKRPRMYEKMMT